MPLGAGELEVDAGAAVAVGELDLRAGPIAYLSPHSISATSTGYRSSPFWVSRYSCRARWPRSWYGTRYSIPSATRRESRSLSTWRGAWVRRRMSSNRRTPLNASRSIRNVHLSPMSLTAAAIVQLVSSYSRIQGRAMVAC